jgi:ADP-ribosylation factor GTPase-activating protein 1
VSLDKWKDIELEKMKVGGNRKAKMFFESQPDYKPGMSIQQKYNSKAAALYRDKISTEASGKPWSESTSSAANYQSNNFSSSSSSSNNNNTYSNGSSSSYNRSADNSSFYDEVPNNYQSGGGGISSSEQLKSQTNDFFARKQNENMSKPENLPPNQGGRYSGFGNTIDPPKQNDSEFMSTLTTSLSSFTLNAGKWASVAKDNVVKISSTAAQQAADLGKSVNEKAKEGSLLSSLQYGVGNVSKNLTDVGSKAWFNINSYWGNKDPSQTASITNSSSNSGLFGRSGYNSVPGETGQSSYHDYDSSNYENNNSYSSQSNNINNNNNNNNLENNKAKATSDDWNNWGDENSSWETAAKSSTQKKTSPNENKPAKKTTPKKDLINFDDDKWESVEQSKSK